MPKRSPPDQTHNPTDAQRQTVQLHASVGTRQEVIAEIIGIDPKTLRKHYRDELNQALAKANASIGGALFNKAKSGDTSAMIFWLKTRAGFKETNQIEHTSPDQSMSPTRIEIVAPSNDSKAD